MAKVTIKGQEYELGEIAFTEENIDLFDSVIAAADGDMPQGLMKQMCRLVREALIDGNGEEKGLEAFGKLRLSFSENSDLPRVLAALGGQIKG